MQTQTKTKTSSKKAPKVTLASGQGHRNNEEEQSKLHIRKLVKDNPRREGSHGFKSFAVVKDGMSVKTYLDKGGRMKDLRWDIAHGYLKVE